MAQALLPSQMKVPLFVCNLEKESPFFSLSSTPLLSSFSPSLQILDELMDWTNPHHLVVFFDERTAERRDLDFLLSPFPLLRDLTEGRRTRFYHTHAQKNICKQVSTCPIKQTKMEEKEKKRKRANIHHQDIQNDSNPTNLNNEKKNITTCNQYQPTKQESHLYE
jgi:hypothetical protein